MATFVIPILGPSALPDSNGNVSFQPSNLNGGVDRYDHMVLAFADSATRDLIRGVFRIPKNYVGTPKIVVDWYTVPTSGNVRWDVDCKAIADGESYDPATDDDTASSGDVPVPATARLLKRTEMALSGTYAADDEVQFQFGRDGATETSGVAGTVYVAGLFFQYADA